MKKILLFTALFVAVAFTTSAQWIEQATGFTAASRGIRDISIVDENIVWAVAYDGSGSNANVQQFTKTTDGGATWTPGTINVGNTTLGIAMIHAVSATTAYVAAFVNSTGQQGIFITTDGGTTWTRQTTAAYTSSTSFTNVVYFWGATDGFCMGDPVSGEYEIYTTTDGGTTWTPILGANIPNSLTGEYGYTGQYTTFGDNVWFTTNKGRIYHSTDKGYNWAVYQTPISDFGGPSMSGNIAFTNATNGLLVNVNNEMWETTDAGATWTSLTSTGTHYSTDIEAVPGINGTYVNSGNSSGFAYTNFNGHLWNQLANPGQVLEIGWLNATTGWVGSFNTDATTGGIFKFDGTIPTPLNNDLFAQEITYPTTGLVLSTTEYIEATIVNNGVNPQSNFDVTYSVNGGTLVTETVTATINSGESYTYTFTTPFDFSAAGTYSIEVSTALTSDENTANDNVTKVIELYSQVYERKIIHEQFTTELCQYCPPVLEYMSSLHDTYAPNMITITHHSGYGTDFLTNAAAVDMEEFYNDGGSTFTPGGMFDRHYNGLDNDNNSGIDPGPVFWCGSPYGGNRIDERLALPAFVSVNIDGSFDTQTRELSFTVSGDFVNNFIGDLSINVWLTEDHIAQQSQASAPVGFEHRYTQRAAITNYIGDMLQNGATDGDTYTQTYTYTVDASWDWHNMYIVAFVGNYDASSVNNREVHNANEKLFTELTITSLSNIEDKNVRVYPNPTTGLFNIQGIEGSNVEVVNSLGQVVYSVNNVSSLQTIDLSNNSEGTYFVKIKTNDSVVTRKISYIK